MKIPCKVEGCTGQVEISWQAQAKQGKPKKSGGGVIISRLSVDDKNLDSFEDMSELHVFSKDDKGIHATSGTFPLTCTCSKGHSRVYQIKIIVEHKHG